MANNTLICDLCIRGLRSRGEEIYVGEPVNIDEDSETKECYFCKQDYIDDVLYEIK